MCFQELCLYVNVEALLILTFFSDIYCLFQLQGGSVAITSTQENWQNSAS